MKITSDYTPDENARLRSTRAAFLKKMESLPERHQRSHLKVTLARAEDEVDPYYRALAAQTLKGYELRDRVDAARKEVAEIEKLNPKEYRPRDQDWYGRAMARKAELEHEAEENLARFVGVHEDRHEYAKKAAVERHRGEVQREQRNAAWKGALAAADANAATDDMRRRAEELADGTRSTSGS